jgi:hypothetical protein
VDQESVSAPGGSALATRDDSPPARQDSVPSAVERTTDVAAPRPELDRLRAAPLARDADTSPRMLAITPRQEAAAPQEQPAAPRDEPPAPTAAQRRVESFTPPPDTPLRAEARSLQPQQNDAADRARAAAPSPSMAGAAAPPPNEWTLVDYTLAAAMLRQPPLRIPGLEVTGYAIRSARGGSVRVTQRLPGGQTLQLIELPAGSDLDARLTDEASRLPADGMTNVTIERAGVGITGRAAVPVDSLRVLLQQVQ